MPATSFSVFNALMIPSWERQGIEALYSQFTDRRPVKIAPPGGRGIEFPTSLKNFLLPLLRDLRDGKSVTVLRGQHSLSTAQAGRILGMSRQFLVDLLEGGAIPFHRVGNHRRVYLSDVLLYKHSRDRVASSEAKPGLYDQIPEEVLPRRRARRCS